MTSFLLTILGGVIAGLIAHWIPQWLQRPRLKFAICRRLPCIPGGEESDLAGIKATNIGGRQVVIERSGLAKMPTPTGSQLRLVFFRHTMDVERTRPVTLEPGKSHTFEALTGGIDWELDWLPFAVDTLDNLHCGRSSSGNRASRRIVNRRLKETLKCESQ